MSLTGGAESFVNLIARVDELERRVTLCVEGQTLVFTHGYFMKALLLRRDHPSREVDANFMAAFRDGRKNDMLPNTGMIVLPRGTSP